MEKKILIIEDDPELADNAKDLLLTEDYHVCAILDSSEGLVEVIEDTSPSAVLLDIQLRGGADGIEIAHMIRNRFHMPLVFFTSSSDKETIERAKHISPDGYILKPFSKDVLITTLTLAISNFRRKAPVQQESQLMDADRLLNGSIFIRDKGYLKKMNIADIDWVKGDGSYTHISVKETVYTLRNYLKDVLHKLPGSLFCKISKAYVVNLNNIEAVSSKEVIIRGRSIPVGRNFYQEIIARINQISR